MLFIYITIVAFALVFAADELAAWFHNRKSRHTAVSGPETPQTIHTAIHSVGEACEAAQWPWPENVRPIHHRRSQTRPHLRIVPVDQETAAMLGRDSAA